MIFWVSSEMVMTWPMRRRMYLGRRAVGVVDDAGARVGGDTVLVDDPFEGGAIAEALVKDGGRDTAQGEEVVVADFGFVAGSSAHGVLLWRDVRGAYVSGLRVQVCVSCRGDFGTRLPDRRGGYLHGSEPNQHSDH